MSDGECECECECECEASQILHNFNKKPSLPCFARSYRADAMFHKERCERLEKSIKNCQEDIGRGAGELSRMQANQVEMQKVVAEARSEASSSRGRYHTQSHEV